jgi:hypothetical protein
MKHPVEAEVAGHEDSELEIRLEPVGEMVTVTLRLPDGAPAAGAEALLVESLADGAELFNGRADGGGLLRLPRGRAGFALVRHPRAGFLVREWSPATDEGEVTWELPAAHDRALTIHAKDSTGRSAVPGARIALWAAGHRLSGRPLGWAAAASPFADVNGYWIGHNLPRGPLAVLAWGLTAREDASAGALDSLATVVEPPWPEPLEVRVID